MVNVNVRAVNLGNAGAEGINAVQLLQKIFRRVFAGLVEGVAHARTALVAFDRAGNYDLARCVVHEAKLQRDLPLELVDVLPRHLADTFQPENICKMRHGTRRRITFHDSHCNFADHAVIRAAQLAQLDRLARIDGYVLKTLLP